VITSLGGSSVFLFSTTSPQSLRERIAENDTVTAYVEKRTHDYVQLNIRGVSFRTYQPDDVPEYGVFRLRVRGISPERVVFEKVDPKTTGRHLLLAALSLPIGGKHLPARVELVEKEDAAQNHASRATTTAAFTLRVQTATLGMITIQTDLSSGSRCKILVESRSAARLLQSKRTRLVDLVKALNPLIEEVTISVRRNEEVNVAPVLNIEA